MRWLPSATKYESPILYRLTGGSSSPRWKALSIRFHLSPTLAFVGRKTWSNSELRPEVLEAGQPIGGGAVSQTGHQPPEERPPAGAGEVRIYLLLEAHVSDHCQTPSLNPTPATPVRRARGLQVRSG